MRCVQNDGIAYYESTGHTKAFPLFAVGLSKGQELLAIIAGERFGRRSMKLMGWMVSFGMESTDTLLG